MYSVINYTNNRNKKKIIHGFEMVFPAYIVIKMLAYHT